MSPTSRASLIRSATSRRRTVERLSISSLSFSRPSGVTTDWLLTGPDLALIVGRGETAPRPKNAPDMTHLRRPARAGSRGIIARAAGRQSGVLVHRIEPPAMRPAGGLAAGRRCAGALPPAAPAPQAIRRT